jgi:hypothetical protein
MKVNYLWATKEIVVKLDEAEAQRLAAYLSDQLGGCPDPEADIPSQLEDALLHFLT